MQFIKFNEITVVFEQRFQVIATTSNDQYSISDVQ
jgi:hypothetical protein